MNFQTMEKQKREAGIRYSLISSLGSKLATAAVQIIAVPIAARALGAVDFSLYVMIGASIGWLGLANFGVGPVLITRIAEACARHDLPMQKRLLSNTVIPIAFICGVAGGAIWLATELFPVEGWLGLGQVTSGAGTREALLLAALFVLAQCILAVPEAAQAGYQEQHLVNTAAALGNVGCLFCLLWVSSGTPTIVGMIAAMNGPIIVLRVANAGLFFMRRRYLWPAMWMIQRPVAAELLGVGTSFSLAAALGNFLCHQYPVILAGRLAGVTEAGRTAVTFQVLVLCSGLIQTMTSSVLPGMSDSLMRKDFSWAQRSYFRMMQFGMGIAVIFGVLLASFGKPLFALWYGEVVQISSMAALGLGAYFVLLTWESLHYSVLLAAGQIVVPSLLYLGRAIAAALLLPIGMGTAGTAVVYVWLSGSILVVTMIPFFRKSRRVLQGSDAVHGGALSGTE